MAKGKNPFAGVAKKAASGGNWMAGAVKHPGAFKAKAKAAGMSTMAYAHKMDHAGGTTGKQAVLAETFAKYRRK